MKLIRLKQGDACALAVTLTMGGQPLTMDDVTEVEFMLGHDVRRTYPAEVTYEDGVFRVPVTQAETLALGEGTRVPLDARVRFSGGDVLGATGPASVLVVDALSNQEV